MSSLAPETDIEDDHQPKIAGDMVPVSVLHIVASQPKEVEMTDVLTRDVLLIELSFDPATGLFRRLRATNAEAVGSIAGNVATNGRRYISVRGVRYMASHLAWLWAHGELPKGYVKQRDGDYENCRPDNLYEESPTESARKGRLRSTNQSGHKGVSFDAGRHRWVASIRVGYKMVGLGRFNTKEEAIATRQKAEADLAAGIGLSATKEQTAAGVMEARLRRLWRKLIAFTDNRVGWASFAEFAADVKTLPPRLVGVAPADPAKMIGPGNWERAERFDRRTPEGRSAYGKHRRAERPELFRAQDMKKRHGKTPEEFDAQLAAQGGGCGSCGGAETTVRNGKQIHLAWDHDHGTQVRRGILCSSCNKMIGHAAEKAANFVGGMTWLGQHGNAECVDIANALRFAADMGRFKPTPDMARVLWPERGTVIPLPRKESA